VKSDEKVSVRISDKALKRIKAKVRALTSRVRRIPAKQMLAELSAYLVGWANYFAKAKGCESQLKSLDGWIRRRVRQWLWVEWKTSRKRRANLLKGGVSKTQAIRASHIRSPWKASKSKALSICITNARIKWGGLVPLHEHWQRLSTL
jgi:RNA-directed DNA polymerase